jgi:hypothetical protein
MAFSQQPCHPIAAWAIGTLLLQVKAQHNPELPQIALTNRWIRRQFRSTQGRQ